MKIRVLIIDDEGRLPNNTIDKLCGWLEDDSEFIVNVSKNIDFTPQEISQIRPDIVIIDIALRERDINFFDDIKGQQIVAPNYDLYSELSGLTYCKEFKSSFADIPVILITKHDDKNILPAALEAGADGVFFKGDLYPISTLSSLKSLFFTSRTDDSILYQAVRSLMDEKSESVWKHEQMSLALDAFFCKGSGPRRLLSLWQYIEEIVAMKLNSNVVSSLLRASIDAESLLIAANPTMRDHIKHIGNVFWVGYYLLNSLEFFQNSKNFDSILGRSSKSDFPNSWDSLNLMWILTALLHDIGYIRECLPLVEDKLQRIQNLLWDAATEVPQKIDAIPKSVKPILSELKSMNDKDANTLYEALSLALEKWKKKKEKKLFRDHGIVSAVAVLRQEKQISDKETNQKLKDKTSPELKHAAIAIAFHNLHKWNKWLPKPAKINIKKFPILWLLSYCDELQGWNRGPDGSALAGIGEKITGHPLEGIENAYIDRSRISNFSCVACENNLLNAQVDIGIQYMLAHGDKTNKLISSFRTGITAWARDNASRIRTTLGLDALITTKILHQVPGLVLEPITIYLDERGDDNQS